MGAVMAAVVWRVSSLLYNESPFDWLRKLLKITQTKPHDTDTWLYPDNIIGEVFGCFWCLSLLASFTFSVLLTISGYTDIMTGVIVWFASATGAIMIERYIGRSRARW